MGKYRNGTFKSSWGLWLIVWAVATFPASFGAHEGHRHLPATPCKIVEYLPVLAGRRLDDHDAPEADAVAASYSRFSSDLQDPSSIAQQQRKCRDAAVANDEVIPADLEFADEAVSGTRRERDGLNAMLRAAKEGRFRTLYLDSLSRLARESVITMPMLKRLVYVDKIRIISVTEGIDSSKANWELIANFMAWVHEQFLKTLRAAVLRGQEHAVLANFSIGDWCLGYGSEPIVGSEVSRRGRHPRPRMRYVIREEHATWVKQIFHWFVVERRSITWIAKELTRRNAPKDHRSTTSGWHPQYVRKVLTNRKYIAIWSWGRMTNVRNPFSGAITQEARPASEVAKWQRELPELRIIDDDTFFKAQAILLDNEEKCAAMRQSKGRLSGSRPEGNGPRHMLQGLIRCGECRQTFQVSGAVGRYLSCVGYKKGECSCKTVLPRQLAEQLLLDLVGRRVLENPAWHQAVLDAALKAWEKRGQSRPNEKKETERALFEVKQKLERLYATIEDGTANSGINDRIAKRCSEQQELERQLDRLRKEDSHETVPPTAEWVREKLMTLQTILAGRGPAAASELRPLLGGTVIVREQERADRKRKFLRGTFRLQTTSTMEVIGIKAIEESAMPVHEEASLDFIEGPPWAALSERVKEAYDRGEPFEAVAIREKCSKAQITKVFQWWYESRGLQAPDGRKDRRH
jgi:site-specific DNA recombinase